jgi:hypothetical protein
MDAWQKLVSSSTAQIGSDAWLHLHSQNTGGGEVVIINDSNPFAVNSLNASLDQEIRAEADNTIVFASINEDIYASIINDIVEARVNENDVEANS